MAIHVHDWDANMSPRKASNWVDRGDALEETLGRVLGHALGFKADAPRLREHLVAIRGLVEADATEVHVTRYVRPLFPLFLERDVDATLTRTLGIALWHIAKAGLVRDGARRRIDELTRQLPRGPRLADQLRDAILGAPVEESTRAPAVVPSPTVAAAMRRR
jgi:hypothetical protein